MVPLIGFIVLVIDLYIWVVIAGAILSWLIAFNVVNTNNRFVYQVADMLYRVTEPALRPIRSILPSLGGIDISPVILILFLLFIRDVVLPRLDPASVRAGRRSLSGASVKLNLRRVDAGVILPVRLTPKSGRDEIVGVEAFGVDAVLKARVRAVPEGGKANAALEKLIGSWLKLPPSRVTVTQGGASRMKQVLIEGHADAVARLIETRLAALSG